MMGVTYYVCPTMIVLENLDNVQFSATLLPFNRAITKAINRIGPHRLKLHTKVDLSPTCKVSVKGLSKLERDNLNLTSYLKSILTGLLLGDVCAVKRSTKGNTYLYFEQGFVHKEYIFHLYSLFEKYGGSPPKISDRLPDKRTGNVYTRVRFITYSLPCFNEFYNLFYSSGSSKKVVPLNIAELLTTLGLAYWIYDDGSFSKRDKLIRIATNYFTLEEVNLLLDALRKKFNLNCKAIKDSTGYVINIYPKSIPHLR